MSTPAKQGVKFADEATILEGSNRDQDETESEEAAAQILPNQTASVGNSFRSKVLRSNLTRSHKNRDPLFYYEVQQVLGVGSMGSVVKVRKRDEAVGGSARQGLQGAFKRERLARECIHVPIVGWIVRHCLGNPLENPEKNTDRGSLRNILSFGSQGSPFKPVNESIRSLDTLSSGGDTKSSKPYDMNYAMKSIHLSRVTDETFVEELRNEITVLKALDHPHIVRCIETFEHRHQIFIIMESCNGGDLYSRDPYTEDEAARIISSILSAVSYMHHRQITHRDLKYENVLFVSDHPQSEIKVIDFGLSKKYGKDEELMDGVGTIYTMAPEVLKGQYSNACDLWSIGVISYMLLSSQMPFYGKKRRHIVELIMNCKYDFKGRRWKRVSKQAKAFVEDLLVADPNERATADDAYRSNWLNRRQMTTIRSPYEEETKKAQQSLLKYAGYSKLKKVAMMVVAHKSNTEEIGILRKVFQNYDTNKSGDIDYEEFVHGLASSGYTEEQLRPIFDAVDLDGSGRIRYTEFLAATMELHGAIREELLAEAFDRLDSDDSGFISAKNLSEILGADFSKEEIDGIVEEATGSKDKKMSYTDFLRLWEEKKEDEREKVIQELSLVEDETSSVGSDEVFADGEEAQGSASFIGTKIAASAKMAQAHSLSDQMDAEEVKKIFDDGGIVIIADHKEAEV